MKNSDERFFARHDIFIRKAREACHQSLFFLDLLYESTWESANRAIEDYRIFALHQVKALVRGVFIPSDCQKREKELAAMPKGDLKKTTESAVALCKSWESISEYLKQSDEITLNEVPELRQDLINFLETSSAKTKLKRLFQHILPNSLHYLHKKKFTLCRVTFFAHHRTAYSLH